MQFRARRQAGMNFQAQPLQQHEADAIKADPEAKARLIKSYALMLDFYGMELEDRYVDAYQNNWCKHFTFFVF